VEKRSCLDNNKKKVAQRLKIRILFSRVKKQYFYLLAALFSKILFLPLENKTHIFALALLRCYPLYILFSVVSWQQFEAVTYFTEGMVC